jgi:Holliday junction resolvase-like predicted endonuclease
MTSMNSATSKALLKMLEHRSIRFDQLSNLELDEDCLDHLRNQNIVRLDSEALYVVDPIRLAIEAIKSGVDVEAVSELLNWRDFESLCAEALRSHDYGVRAPLRFKVESKRHEVDIVAHKRGILLCVDCKHWKTRRGQRSKVKDAVMSHFDKCVKLALSIDVLRSAGLEVYSGSYVVPVIVTLMDLGFKDPLNGVCVLPVFKFNSFLLDLEAHVDELSYMTTL